LNNIVFSPVVPDFRIEVPNQNKAIHLSQACFYDSPCSFQSWTELSYKTIPDRFTTVTEDSPEVTTLQLSQFEPNCHFQKIELVFI